VISACSGGSLAIEPHWTSPQSGAHLSSGGVQGALSPFGLLNINRYGHQLKSFYACPAMGPIKYLSDSSHPYIFVYAGKFAGQTWCGLIMSASLNEPGGLYVKTTTHDLYVANWGFNKILVFHRGQTEPYNVYTDPTLQNPIGVTTANDGTVIASNAYQPNHTENGSISTWIEGPNGGTFVGNFSMTNDSEGYFVTVQKNGKVYYDDVDLSGSGALWSLSCPAGHCGIQTQVAGVSLKIPRGLASDGAEDLIVIDTEPGRAETFELPNPNPVIFPLAGFPDGVAINELDHHLFVADSFNQVGAEYLYPSGVLVGTVQCGTACVPFGIAVDPGHAR